MTNREKYDNAFIESFNIDKATLTQALQYQSIPEWDSVGHMSLIAALEDAFEIMMEMDDIVDFGSYMTGVETLKKYGVDLA